jgi:hypothetical protein
VAVTELGTQLTELHYQQQTALRAKTMQDTLRLWPAVDVSSIDALNATWPPFEQAQLTLIQARYGNSAGLAARYYEMFRAAEGIGGSAGALLAEPLPDEQLITSIRVTGLYETRKQLAVQAANVEKNALVRLLGATTRLVGNGGRNTVVRSVDNDSRALGYARVTSRKACSFCSLLASRGPVYKGTTADFKAHDHCSCSSEPVYSRDQPWPGNSQQLRDLYNEVTADAENSADARRLFRQAVENR